MSIDTAAELEEYLGEILDVTIPANKDFVQELLSRWQQRNGIVHDAAVYCTQVCLVEVSFIYAPEAWIIQ